jgi:hypothetical protein
MKMHIFLDTNVIYDDYFFERFYTKLLIDICRENGYKLYMSRIVLEETRGKYLEKVRSTVKELIRVKGNTEKNKLPIKIEFDSSNTEEEANQRFSHQIESFVTEGILEIIEMDSIIFDSLIYKTINLKKPYGINNQYKDTLIWLSYAAFVEKNQLDSSYLITDNKSDFLEDDGNIHKDLLEDTKNIVIYRSLKQLFQEVDILTEHEERYRFIQDVEDDYLISKLETIKHKIEDYFLDIIDRIGDISELHDDYFMGGYVTSSGMEPIITEIVEYDFYELNGKLNILGNFVASKELEVYLYNPVYESKEDKHQFAGTGDLLISFNFSIEIDQNHEINNIDISDPYITNYKDYVEMFRGEHEFFDNYTD